MAAVAHRVTVTSWKVEISLSEEKEDGWPGPRVTYFATEDLAKLAVEWAYAVHVEKIRSRADASEIKETPDPNSGAWKIQGLYGKKLVWWRKTPGKALGFSAMKDYFTAEEDVFEREVIG